MYNLIFNSKAFYPSSITFRYHLFFLSWRHLSLDPSPCSDLPPNSMSDDEQESGCDTVESSPASDTTGHGHSPFIEQRYIADNNQNCEPRVACVAPETEPGKPTVRTVVVPPLRVQNNNNNAAVTETPGHTGTTWQMTHTCLKCLNKSKKEEDIWIWSWIWDSDHQH